VGDAKTPQYRAIALYKWILTHQWHLMSPQEWNVPGETPDTQKSNEDLLVLDANRARFSYGYALCGTVHAWNEPYWKALGMQARRRAFPGHTNSEIFYDKGWHAFDTDMAGLVFREDGVVAGYDDIIKQPSLVRHSRPPIPCYPFAWPSDFEGMQQGWKEIAAGGQWYKMYNSGYEAQPGIVQLRRGETFTRWFDPDHFGGPTKRRFWHNLKNGPFRDWTFVNCGEPEHPEGKANCRGNASYCNGEFVYRLDFRSKASLEGIVELFGLELSEQSPRLRVPDGRGGSAIFEHFSPYVICGDPVDDANPMSGKATDGFIVEGKGAVGVVDLDVSVDQGQTWQHIALCDGTFRLDLTEHVKGRYGWQVRLRIEGKSGIDELTFTTTTQVCQAIYPRLSPGGSKVTYRAGSRGVTPILPNWSREQRPSTWLELEELRSPNATYKPRSKSNRFIFETNNNKPGQVVFAVNTDDRELTEIRAAARYRVRVPPPEGCDYHLEYSIDEGRTWTTFATSEIPADNEFSSGWVWGRAAFENKNDQPIHRALVKVHFYQGGYQTGLIDAQIYGVHRTPAPSDATLTYGWKESGESKTHVEQVKAATAEHQFTVPTGKNVVDEFVRIEVP
jgi:hypothetical protein